MKPFRLILIVLGSLAAIIGVSLMLAGGALGIVTATQRDNTGFFTTPTERYSTDSYAITSDEIDLGQPGPDDWWADRDLVTVRLVADNAQTGSLFIGIGPEADVEHYLDGVVHDEITDVRFDPFRSDTRTHHIDGIATPAPPADQTFWVAQASGPATQTLTWDARPGRWALVVMNTDATTAVSADVEVGAQIDGLVPLTIVLLGSGLVVLLIAVGLIVAGAHRDTPPRPDLPTTPATAPATTPAAAPGATSVVAATRGAVSPVSIEGHLDPVLSRWLWLVKWLLIIPHAILLVFLWIAFVVLTAVAFVAIVVTGRYPRRIFDFNVGVLRWTWRVGFYATSALGTDRYPPFTLAAVEYPATLDVAYPERLSRGLVLVKSWLLAIPHLAIVAVLTASWTFGDRDGARIVFGGGLLGIAVVIAGLALLFTGRHPRGLFDLVMGANRWVYRTIAYVALMTDRYPPFHLDQGGTEPDQRPPTPTEDPSTSGAPVTPRELEESRR